MLRDVFLSAGIDCFCAVPVADCQPGNMRLYGQVPAECMAIFCLFPYYVSSDAVQYKPRLSRFAAVPDYHLFAKALFSEMEADLAVRYPGRYCAGFSDHSPFDERYGAARAGLGIIGRNGLLISEKYASFVCIGELVTALSEEELAAEGIDCHTGEIRYCPDCGECRKCCPGGCAGTDSRMTCVSALNQKKGELSIEQAALIRKSGYVWGCDACQLACPYTKRAMAAGTLETGLSFFRDGALGRDFISEIRSMDDATYAQYPFSWRRRDVMERNFSVFAENTSKEHE